MSWLRRWFVNFFVLTSLAVFPEANAGLSDDLNSFYNKVGGGGANVTAPTAYKSQAAGYYSGGSVVARNRVKNIELVHVDLPTMRSGCGGIDLFLGGFSYVNADALVAFFKQLMSNSVGYSFNLALETMAPSIAHNMQYIQKLAQDINSQNFNSCETAEALVGGMWPKVAAGQRKICQDIGTSGNKFADWAAARQECGDLGVHKYITGDKAAERSRIIEKNLVWEALKERRIGDAELFMSLSGTIIYGVEGKAKIISPLVMDRELVKALLIGGEVGLYHCDNQDKCLNPKTAVVKIEKERAFYSRVQKNLFALFEAIKTDTPLSDELKTFLELTKLPLLKFMMVNAMNNSDAISLSLTNYSETIAKTMLVQYLHEILQIVSKAVAAMDYDPEVHKQFADQVYQAVIFIEQLKTESNQDTQELMRFIDSSKVAEREVTSRVVGETYR